MRKYIVHHGIRIAKDFVPETFGRLTTLGPAFRLPATETNRGKSRPFHTCLCTCGDINVYARKYMVSGNTKSCGCLKIERASAMGKSCVIHGLKKLPEYQIWRGMRKRCNLKSDPGYVNYGGRGIFVCDRWEVLPNPKGFGFIQFLGDMGRRPSKKHSPNRIDNDGPYSPENCEWATAEEQMNNTRMNNRVEIDGVTKTTTEWSIESGVHRRTIAKRISQGYPAKEAVFCKAGALVCKPRKPRKKKAPK